MGLVVAIFVAVARPQAFPNTLFVIKHLAHNHAINSEALATTEVNSGGIGVGLLKEEVLVVLHDKLHLYFLQMLIHSL